MAFRLRTFRESDWEAFAGFARRYFGQSHLARLDFNAHWFRTPWSDGWQIRLLEDESGGLAGAACAIVVRAKLGSRVEKLAWLSSTAATEAARSRGAGAQLFFWVHKTFPMVGSMSGNENSRPISAVIGRDVPGLMMRRFVFVHQAGAGRLCRPGREGAALAAREVSGRPAEVCSGIPQGYGELWREVRERYYLTTERDDEFLDWRYRRAPYVRYHFWACRQGRGLQALAVARLQVTPVGAVCRVMDFIAQRDRATACWRAVLARARQEGALFTDFIVSGTGEDAALAEAGLLPADASTGLDALPNLLSPIEHRAWSNSFHLGGRAILADQAWRRPDAVFFTKGDSDRDWPTTCDVEGAARAA